VVRDDHGIRAQGHQDRNDTRAITNSLMSSGFFVAFLDFV
jgi:hypothetical protein